MKIDLAVYTGDSGYDWHHAGAFTSDELIAYKRIMGKFPDPDFGRMPFGGAFNEGSWLVFYRYHYAKRWDNLGRDSLYVVLGRVPLASAAAVDFKCAFALTEMNQPMKPFPATTTYFGPRAAVAPSYASQRLFTGTDALSYLGAWFVDKPEGRLVVTIDGDYANPRVLPRFEQAATPVSHEPAPTAPTFGGTSSAGWTPGARRTGVASADDRRTVPQTVCLALSAGLFVLGCVCGYAVRGWIGKGGSIGDRISEKVTEVTGYKIEKVPQQPKSDPSSARICPSNAPSADLKKPSLPATSKPDGVGEQPPQPVADQLDRKIGEVTTNVIQKIERIRRRPEKASVRFEDEMPLVEEEKAIPKAEE